MGDGSEISNERSVLSSLAVLSGLTGVLVVILVIVSVAGIMTPEIYAPFAEPKYVQESRAQDLVTLFLGVPLLIVSLVAARLGKPWACALWAGVLAYELYVNAIYAIGGVYNGFIFLYVAATALALYGLVGLISAEISGGGAGPIPRLPRRWFAGFFALVVVVFGFIWSLEVIGSISSGQAASGHLIFMFDLIVVLPAFALGAVHLLKGTRFGDFLAGVLLVKLASLCVSITLGQMLRYANQIAVEFELLTVFVPLGLICIAMAALYFRRVAAAD